MSTSETRSALPSTHELMSSARAQTGVDIVDSDIEDRLGRLLESLGTEASLTPQGADAMEARLMRLLSNRLRMLRDLERHPEILEQEIIAPVFLTSAPRTGSTKLHKLLAASGDFLAIQGWQGLTLALRTGDRSEDPAPRIQDSEAYEQWFRAQAPEAMRIHQFSTYEPDEDSLLLEHCLYGLYMTAFAFVPSYGMWYAGRDFRSDMAFVKQGLQYLQWQFHDGDSRRWVLKCPGYLGLESVVAEFFPDATFVTTNRHPSSTMSSVASLLSNYHRAYSDANRNEMLGQMMLEGFAASSQQHLDSRKADSEFDARFLDVGYTELVEDAGAAVARIYAHVGLTPSEEASNRMREWEAEHSLERRAPHKYTLEEYALTSEMVNAKFAEYISRFADRF